MWNSLLLGALVRGVVTAASGVIVGKGYATGDEFSSGVAALTGLASILYSIYTRTTNKQISDTVSLPKVASITTTAGKTIRTSEDLSNKDSAR